MADFSQLIITFINPVVLVLALVMVLSMAYRTHGQTQTHDLLCGAVFAAAVVYSMSDPIDIPTGGIIDMRGMLIGTAVALLGPKVGLFAVTAGLAMRGYIGGEGMYAGLAAILLAFAGGWIWRVWLAPRNMQRWKETALLGTLISSQSLAIFITAQASWGILFATVATYTTICNFLGTFVFRYMLDDQMRHLSHKSLLEQEAITDHLTGLTNRRSLEAQFADIKNDASEGLGLTALYFDIDHFKLINDTYGHAVGDRVLKVLTDRLATAFRARDIFCRIGGDEFVVVLPNLNKEEAARIAELCRLLVANQPIATSGFEIHATISIGAIWTCNDISIEGLLQMADQALYDAKAMGRNAVAFRSRPVIIKPRAVTAAA